MIDWVREKASKVPETGRRPERGGRILKRSPLCSRLSGGPGTNLVGLIFFTYKMEGWAQMIRHFQRFLNSALRGNQRVGQSWAGETEEPCSVSDLWRRRRVGGPEKGLPRNVGMPRARRPRGGGWSLSGGDGSEPVSSGRAWGAGDNGQFGSSLAQEPRLQVTGGHRSPLRAKGFISAPGRRCWSLCT